MYNQMLGENPDSSPGRQHTIRIYQKELKVTLNYHSPAKDPNREQIPSPTDPAFTIHTHHAYTTSQKKKKQKMYKAREQLKPQKQFYRQKVTQVKLFVLQYEQFQQNMLERKHKRKLKVYSNSKTDSLKGSPLKYQRIPLRVINLKQNKPKSSVNVRKEHPHIRLRKGNKDKNNSEVISPVKKYDKKIGHIRLYGETNAVCQKRHNTSKQRRSHKIEVTSSRSRRKQKSAGQRMGIQSIKERGGGNTSIDQHASIVVNSFTTSVFP